MTSETTDNLYSDLVEYQWKLRDVFNKYTKLSNKSKICDEIQVELNGFREIVIGLNKKMNDLKDINVSQQKVLDDNTTIHNFLNDLSSKIEHNYELTWRIREFGPRCD